jgi:adenosylcobinamide-GDP ribazoletransferase
MAPPDDRPAARSGRWTGPLEAVAVLTALRVPAGVALSFRGVLPWAPLVGLLLGGVAAGVAVLGARWITAPVGAVLAVAVLAAATRGLHLDGLADTADGLGPLRDRERALAVMRAGDVGPFGVATLVLTLLLQVACAAALLPADGGWLAVGSAVLTGRLALVRAGLPGVAVSEGSALGRAVAGTVSRGWYLAAVACGALMAAGAAGALGSPAIALQVLGATAGGLLAAELLHRRAVARLGGTSGDVMGATAEVATSVHLLVAAALW